MVGCSHQDPVSFEKPPASIAGCEASLKRGVGWLNLAICKVCGGFGSCDESSDRHSTEHNRSSGHSIIRSAWRGVVLVLRGAVGVHGRVIVWAL